MNNKQKTINLLFRFMDESTKDDIKKFISESNINNSIEFNTSSEVDMLFKDRVDEYLTFLSDEEVLDLRNYTGYEYRNINAVLRNDWNYEINGKISEDKLNYYNNLSNSIEKIIILFPSINANFKVYRGTNLSYFKNYGVSSLSDLKSLENNFLFDEGFTSTSILSENSFYKKTNDLGINYNINIVYNIDGRYSDGALLTNDALSYSKSQSEYLINKSNLSYVNKVEIDEVNNTAVIYVTLIPTKVWDKYRYEKEKKPTI